MALVRWKEKRIKKFLFKRRIIFLGDYYFANKWYQQADDLLNLFRILFYGGLIPHMKTHWEIKISSKCNKNVNCKIMEHMII